MGNGRKTANGRTCDGNIGYGKFTVGWKHPLKRAVGGLAVKQFLATAHEESTFVAFDANSGNGVSKTAAHGNTLPWTKGCTPGILARLVQDVSYRRYAAEVRLHEFHTTNHAMLLDNLEIELPKIHYMGQQWVQENGLWVCGSATLSVDIDSSVDDHKFPEDASVLLFHDPNTISGWSLSEDLVLTLDDMDNVIAFHTLVFDVRNYDHPQWQEALELLEFSANIDGRPGLDALLVVPSIDEEIKVKNERKGYPQAYLIMLPSDMVPEFRGIARGMTNPPEVISRRAYPSAFNRKIKELSVPKRRTL